MCLDRLHRVDTGAEALRHAPPVGCEDGRVDDHVGERDLPEVEEAGEDHPVLPEPDDLARGRVDVAGVITIELRCCRGPAERGERPQRGREPRVEDVGIALELAFPHSAQASGGGQAQVRWPSAHLQIGIWCPPRADATRTSRAPARATRSRSGAGSPGGNGRDARGAPRAPERQAPPSRTTTAATRAARSASGTVRTSRPSGGTARASGRARARPPTRSRGRRPPSGPAPRIPRRSSARPARSR